MKPETFKMDGGNLADYTYKAIVVLNNVGVELLAHGQCTDAANTIKDAIQLMKTSFFQQACPIPTTLEIDQALRSAQSRLFKNSRQEIISTSTADHPSLVIVSNQDNAHEVYSMLERHSKSHFCIKIDPLDYYSSYEQERLETESAILLYNYGMVYQCASEEVVSSNTSNDVKQKAMMKETAIRVFHMAHSLMSKVFPKEQEIPVPSQVLLVSFLTTVTLLELSSHNNSSSTVSQLYSEDFLDLLEAIFEQLMLHSDTTQAAAGAA